MSDYFFRWYDMRRRLWERGWDDYNHLWAEPFLNMTLRDKHYNVVREPQVLNYTEFDEIPKPRTYIGDDATRRRLAATAPAGGGPLSGAGPGGDDAAEQLAAAAAAPFGDAAALARQLRQQAAEIEALQRRLAQLQQRAGSGGGGAALSGEGGATMDVLEEAAYDPATGERIPLLP